MNDTADEKAGFVLMNNSSELRSANAPSERTWTLSTTPVDGIALSVCFRRDGDRFRHELILSGATDLIPLESVEVLDEIWPPSAPLQQVDQCELSDGRAGIVAVGLAGRSHWSLAIEAFSDHLRFEVACRASTQPAGLASTYRVEPTLEVRHVAEHLLLVVPERDRPVDRPAGILRLTAGAQTELVWQPETHRVALSPLMATSKFPATVVWAYEVAWVGRAK